MLCIPQDDTTLAIAVSGGADSMALLLMAHERAQQNGGRVVALTVDHGLRKESATEARQVRGWCKEKNIEHHILEWRPLDQVTQADARDARYALLTGWCRDHSIPNLLTAHHRGDQAETLFFRLARGSGILGLACMQPVSEMDGVRLIRPLLSCGKSSLESYLRDRNQPWIEDPSNLNPRYARNIIRRHLQSLPDADEIEARAAAVAEAFGRIRAALDRLLEKAMTETVERHPGGSAVLHAAAFRNLPPELGRMMLSRLVQSLSAGNYPARSKKIERLYDTLCDNHATRVTLANLLFTYRRESGHFVITPHALAS